MLARLITTSANSPPHGQGVRRLIMSRVVAVANSEIDWTCRFLRKVAVVDLSHWSCRFERVLHKAAIGHFGQSDHTCRCQIASLVYVSFRKLRTVCKQMEGPTDWGSAKSGRGNQGSRKESIFSLGSTLSGRMARTEANHLEAHCI